MLIRARPVAFRPGERKPRRIDDVRVTVDDAIFMGHDLVVPLLGAYTMAFVVAESNRWMAAVSMRSRVSANRCRGMTATPRIRRERLPALADEFV